MYPEISYNGPHWFVGQVRYGKEARVGGDLASKGYRVYFPKIRRWASHARQKKVVYRPVLPTYIFIEIDYPRQSFPVIGDRRDGLQSFLSNCGAPAPIPDRFVDRFIISELRGDFDEIKHDPLPVGANVAIMEGEFRDMCATVISKKHGIVTVKPVGTSQVVRAHFNTLRPAEPGCVLVGA